MLKNIHWKILNFLFKKLVLGNLRKKLWILKIDLILFKLISKDKTYTNEYENCRKNFDKFSVLLMNFLRKKQYSFKKIRNVFINQGPGKYTSIRTSMAIIKALQLVYGFNYYGFNNKDKVDGDYKKILQLFRQKKLIKNLIKPLYLS